MKKKFVFLVTVFCLAMMTSAQTFLVTIDANYFTPDDSAFTELYGSKKYFPEGKIAIKFYNNFYIWGAFGFFSSSRSALSWSSKNVEEADLEISSEFNKKIVSCGFGYYAGYFEKQELALKLELGLCKIFDREQVTSSELDSNNVVSFSEEKISTIGYRGTIGAAYGLMKNVHSEFNVGYIFAPKKINDVNVNLGGFRMSLGLGLNF